MKLSEIREMSPAALNEALKEQKEELFNLRFKHSINQLDNPMIIGQTKKTIAQILTVLREKEISEGKNLKKSKKA